MKSYVMLLPILLLAACVSKPVEKTGSDNEKLERYFEQLFHKKVTATVYIVHPEICGACSNEFLVKMSEQKPTARFYLLATGEFKAEHKDAANKIRQKIRFIKSSDISRKGLSALSPQKIMVRNGKITSVEIMEL